MIRSCNPAFSKAEKYSNEYVSKVENVTYDKATYKGVGLKLLYFILMTVVGAAVGIFGSIILLASESGIGAFVTGVIVTFIIIIISAIIAMSNYKKSLLFGTIYCLGEGAFLGLVSFICEIIYSGIVLTVVVGTFSTILVCAVLFATGVVKVNKKFNKFLLILAGGFIATSLIVHVVSLISGNEISWGLTLAINLVSVLIASLFLISDMDRAYQLVNNNGPKEMEWMVSFGLAYTVLWIYIELLRIAVIILDKRK